MSSLPRLDVSLSSRRISCVLDGELAFSRQGLLFATRLAQELDVWLFRALWQALDNSYIFSDSQEPAGNGQRAFPSLSTLQQWEAARLETDLSGLQFFFVGDARHESLLPKDVSKDLVKRFELFSEELDALHGRPCDENEAVYDPVYECSRDAAALATALIRNRPVVLSLCRRGMDQNKEDYAEPLLCGFLRRCGIESQLVDSRNVAALRGYFQPIFARSGLSELVWDMWRDHLDLAIVHIVTPRALVIPAGDGDSDRGYGEEFAPSLAGEGRVPFWFHEAKAYWWKYA